MKSRPEEELLQLFIDGHLDRETNREVVTLLKSDPELLDLYCEYANLDGEMRHLLASHRGLGEDQSLISSLAQQRTIRKTRWVSVITAVAAVLTLGVIFYFKIIPVPPMVAVRSSPGTVLKITHPQTGESAPPAGTLENGSVLSLQSGSVEITFASGVRSIIRGPAEITALDSQRLSMAFGEAWFRVPSEAIGFQVRTPELDVVDLGTEFGVFSSPEFEDQVHVFSGKVRVTAVHGVKQNIVLTANEARRVGPIGHLKEVPLRDDELLTALPTERIDGAIDTDFEEATFAEIGLRFDIPDPERAQFEFDSVNDRLVAKSFGQTEMFKFREKAPIAFLIKPQAMHWFVETEVQLLDPDLGLSMAGLVVYEDVYGAVPPFTFALSEWHHRSIRVRTVPDHNRVIDRPVDQDRATLRIEVSENPDPEGLSQYTFLYDLSDGRGMQLIASHKFSATHARVGLFLKTSQELERSRSAAFHRLTMDALETSSSDVDSSE